MTVRIWWLALAVVASTATAAAERLPPLPDSVPSAYRLGPGDEVRVTVFGLDAATNTYVVGDTGTIAVPLLPLISAAGKSADELQAALVEALRARELVRVPSVTVQIQKYRPFFILGEVQKPGQYPFVPGMSVLTAVSIAGGYTFRADKKHVVVVRVVDGKSTKGGAVPETPVQPGDTISIPESWF